MLSRSFLLALAAASIVNASPCPFGQMAEAGQLSEREEASFYKVRSEGSAAVEEMMSEAEIQRRDAEWADQEAHYNEQRSAGKLPMGGGLLKGSLQPFTGLLSKLDIPAPQKVEEVIVPDAAHPFKFPKKTAVRGMCPTLNTMANHGYINRNGITDFAQAANACQLTLGFGYDTCVFLSGLGLLSGGDIPSGKFSIGGADPRVPNTLGPSLGLAKHGPFEVDQSISRQDYYFGSHNPSNFHLERFNRWTRIADKHNGLYDFDTMNEERQVSFKQSLDTNPHFDAEVKGFAVTLAERVFIPRALTNFSHPNRPDFQNIGVFYLNETFPDAWFKRGSSYGLEDVGLDIVNLYQMGPTPIGHNEGLDNFIGTDSSVDFANLTPNQATCLLYENILDVGIGSFSPTIANNLHLVNIFLEGALKPFFRKYKCDFKSFEAPAAKAGSNIPGKSTKCNIIINGHYKC